MTTPPSERDEGEVAITLSREMAFVLDNLLEQWLNSGAPRTLTIGNNAEWHSLGILHAEIQGKLIHLYSQEDYAEQIALARQAVVDFYGEVEQPSPT